MDPNERSGGADADAADRACTWAAKLAELGRLDEAKRVLAKALDDRGGPAPVARLLALLEATDGATDRTLDLLRGILRTAPADNLTAEKLIGLLLAMGRPDEAAEVITGLTNWRTDTALRELVGKTYRKQGKHAEAVAAFDPPESLSRNGRKLRRRSWWRSGGPLRHRVPWLAIPEGPVLTRDLPRASQPFDAMLDTITWARRLSAQDRHGDARQVISEALETHGRSWLLLSCAAEVESAAKAWNTAVWYWRETLREVPGDVNAVCELAWCLSRIWVKPAYTSRLHDAFRVIDDFPDQSDPKIRATRVDLLRRLGVPAARIAAACGRTWGLRKWARRYRWRSVGPLGQLALRVADHLRGGPPNYAGSGPVSRTEAATEPIARVLDEVDSPSPSAARERVEEAIAQYGRQPALLLAAAEAERGSRYWRRVALTAEAARNDPDSLDAVCSLAKALRIVGHYGVALQVLNNLSADTRARPEVRGMIGELHGNEGNFSLAVSTYGNPRTLDSFDRKYRRRYLLRALVQRMTSRRQAPTDGIDLAIFELLTPAVAEMLDLRFGGGTVEDSRDQIRAAVREHGRNPWLLLALAYHEAGQIRTALATEAMQDAPENPIIMAEGIRQLWYADDTEALRAIRDLADDLLDSPSIQEISYTVLHSVKLYGHAHEALGHSGLSAQSWKNRRECWWRSGGPVSQVRDLIMTAERRFLALVLAEPETQATELRELAPTRAVAESISEDLVDYRLGHAGNTTLAPALSDLWFVGANRLISIACAGAAIFEHWRWSTSGLFDLTGATALAIVALTLLVRWGNKRLNRRAIRIGLLAGIGSAGTVLLLVPAQERPLGVALATIMFLTVSAASFGLRPIVNFPPRKRALRWQQIEARTAILEALLNLLAELRAAGPPENDTARRQFADDLEPIAVLLERDLPCALRAKDAESQRALVERARNAADAVRRLKMNLVLPTQAARQEATEVLTRLAEALIRHDYPHWPATPTHVVKHRPPLPPWKQAERIGRTVLVISVPALAAFVLPLFLPMSGTGLPWFRFASIIWAVLSTVVALDPAWSERIAKMREGLDLLRNATAPAPSATNSSSAKSEDAAGAPAPSDSREDLARRARDIG